MQTQKHHTCTLWQATMLGAEITFIPVMKQSISDMTMDFLHPKDALLAVSTTT